jgi:hypothetical protein
MLDKHKPNLRATGKDGGIGVRNRENWEHLYNDAIKKGVADEKPTPTLSL